MIIYAKISQNIFLLVFLLTRLHDNELKLFIHDFEYSTIIDNTGSRQSFRSSEARKKFNHTSLYEGQGSPLQLSHLHLSLLFFTGQYLTEFLLINVHIDQFYRFEQTVTGYVLRQFGQELCQENELLMDQNFLIKLQDSCKVNQKISIIYGFQVLQKQIQVQYSSIKKDNSPFDK